jgi:phytoene dehydrogenase-like protein
VTLSSGDHIEANIVAAKVHLVLNEELRVNGMPADAPTLQKMLFTLVPTFEQAQRCYNASQTGELEPDLWVDCVWASALDPELATPGHHVLPGWAHYRTPIEGLYLCGAGTHPGGGVTGAPGYNAAHKILKDKK